MPVTFASSRVALAFLFLMNLTLVHLGGVTLVVLLSLYRGCADFEISGVSDKLNKSSIVLFMQLEISEMARVVRVNIYLKWQMKSIARFPELFNATFGTSNSCSCSDYWNKSEKQNIMVKYLYLGVVTTHVLSQRLWKPTISVFSGDQLGKKMRWGITFCWHPFCRRRRPFLQFKFYLWEII